MTRVQMGFAALCLSALVLGAYMALAPAAGRPDYFAALIVPAFEPSAG